jgi:hypothetical protein
VRFWKKLLLPSSRWRSKSNLKESGIDTGRQKAGIGVLGRTNWSSGKNLRFLKESFYQRREMGEITALSNQRDKAQ